VDTNRFNRFLLPDTSKKRVRVGCVANLRPIKNVDGFMRAAKIALDRHPQLWFEVVGEGDERPMLERLRAELGLGDRFVLKGSLADVGGFLRTVEILVLPSHSEGMSNALLEAMSAGRAVIATDVGANATLVQHDKSGLITAPGDEAGIADAIGRYLQQPLRAAAYGAAARTRVETCFSRDAMTRRFEDFYEGLAHHREAKFTRRVA
jgi:glycosyltransferase involved in cell wall biosynthesis